MSPTAETVWSEAKALGIAKWQRGQKEHGGDLSRKPTLHEAIDEAIDQVSYLLILRRQVNLAKLHLFDALATGDMLAVRKAANLLQFGNEEGE